MTTDTRTVETIVTTKNSNDTLYMGTQFVWIITSIIAVLLALRALFMMLGIASSSTVASLIYSSTDILMSPFTTLFGYLPIGNTGIEGALLLAAASYIAIGAGINAVLVDQQVASWLTPENRLRSIE